MKKIVTILLALLCVFAMTACNGGSSDNGGGSEGSDTAAIKIGGSGPLTGAAAQYGIAVKTGAEIAVEEINALGGLQLELKVLDDEHDGEKAVNCYAQLVDWGMQASMLCVTTGPSLAVAGQYQEDGYFAMTPSGSAQDIIDTGDGIFRMCFADPEQGVAAADYIAEHALGTKVAVYVKTDDAYSSGVAETFMAEASVKGLEVVNEYGFTSDNATDFPVVEDAEVVFLPLYYEDDTRIIKAFQDAGLTPVFFGVDGFDGALEQEGVDPAMFEGVYYLTPFAYSAADDATKSFTAKFNEKVGNNPNQFAADGYDVIWAIYNALVAGGATADMSAEEVGVLLKEQFKTLTYSGLTGENMTWDASGAVVKAPLVFRIEGGALVAAN
ncbi:MAG: ABC transporter substrate-binding protein [Erysipelotrichaceae bacterium]|nr:ABC transporter substrate-binding protein [Erysipelotrichaceae bacterium]